MRNKTFLKNCGNTHKVRTPNLYNVAKYKYGEMLLVASIYSKSKRDLVGIGQVLSIKRGKAFDIVEINFGGGFTKPRKVVVKEMTARKQLALLKINGYTLMVGKANYEEEMDKQRYMIYAKLFMPFFTPRMVDISNLDFETETTVMTEESEDYKEGEDFLSQFE